MLLSGCEEPTGGIAACLLRIGSDPDGAAFNPRTQQIFTSDRAYFHADRAHRLSLRKTARIQVQFRMEA
jgi:hypothetical protein